MSGVNCDYEAMYHEKEQLVCELEQKCASLKYELDRTREEIRDLRTEHCRNTTEMDYMRGKIEAYEYVLKVQGGRK